MDRIFFWKRTLTSTANNELRNRPSKVNERISSVEWNVFFEKLNQNADSLLHVGFDKEGTPFFVKARESGNYIYIECCSPHFNYAPRAVRADLRYNQEDQRAGRLYMMLIDVPIQHISKGFGNALMRGILRYAHIQGIDFLEGEQHWENEEQRQRQISYYSKYGFDFIRDPELRKTYLRLDLRKGIEPTD